MTAATLTLTDFLLARIAEDEAEARDKGADAMVGHRWKHAPENVYQELQSVVLANSRRVLAECEAKRRIVECHGGDGWDCQTCAEEETESEDGEGVRSWYRSAMHSPCPTLRHLAGIHADHADYRPEWRP